MRVLFLVLLAIVAVRPGWAFDLRGKAEQGGLMIGQAAPGARVSLDGRAVPVDAQGRFLLGFGRDAAATAILMVDDDRHQIAVASRRWDIQRIDGLPPSKVTPDPAVLARIKAENELVAARRAAVTPTALFLGGVAEPADGVVSGVFGSQRILNGEARAPHSGTDIAAPIGTPVRSVADGVVVMVHPDMYFTGATILVDHGLGLMTVYAHLSRTDVREGQPVAKSQPIGTVGASGRATGPHLHWGASWLEVRLDPQSVMTVLGN